MYSCVPANEGKVPGRTGSRIALARSGVEWARTPSRRTSADVQHHGAAAGRPDCRDVDPPGVVVQLVQAQRLRKSAGRVDGQHDTLRPRRAARSAIAAAVVVLPTPPDPQLTMTPTPRSSSRASMSKCRRLILQAPVRSKRRPASTGPTGRCRRPVAATPSVAVRRLSSRSRSVSCRCTRAAWSAASSSNAVITLGCRFYSCGRKPGRSSSSGRDRWPLPLAPVRQARARSRATWLMMTSAPGQARCLKIRDPVQRLLNGHFFKQGHQVHCCARRPDHPHHRIRVRADRADFGEARDLGVHVQEPGDPPVGGASITTAS